MLQYASQVDDNLFNNLSTLGTIENLRLFNNDYLSIMCPFQLDI